MKVVLAYSGGLDTSIILRWLQETYNAEEVLTLIDRVGPEHRVHEVAHELLAHVLDVDVLGGNTHFERLGPSRLDLFTLTEVGGEPVSYTHLTLPTKRIV